VLRLGQSSSNSKRLEIAADPVNMSDAFDLVFQSTTGTKIGTGSGQKLEF
jgi:hypothetical protein